MRASTRQPQDATTITAALLTLLTALESIPTGSPASAAYTAAIRRRGEELAAVGGAEALRSAHAVALAAEPAHAETRGSLIDAAWASVPGWTGAGDAA